MQQTFDVIHPAQVPQPSKLHLSVRYAVATRTGSCLVFDSIQKGASKHLYNMHPWPGDNELYQFIDPLSALWMGLVTVEELGLSQNTIAVLKLAMDDLIP